MRAVRSFALLILSVCASCANEETGPRPAISTREALNEFAAILNRDIPEYREVYGAPGFAVVDGRPQHFFVFDLADTTNVFAPFLSTASAASTQSPFVLSGRGVYHFAPLRLEISFSHIAVLDNGQMRVFSFLNCEGRGESVRDVVEYLTQTGSFSGTVVARVRNYRSYGAYVAVDPQSHVMCR